MPLVVKLDQFRFVNGSDTQLPLDGRNERRTLEQSAGQSFDRTSELLFRFERAMQTNDADVFFTCALLRFDETGCSVDANGQAASDFWIERS